MCVRVCVRVCVHEYMSVCCVCVSVCVSQACRYSQERMMTSALGTIYMHMTNINDRYYTRET